MTLAQRGSKDEIVWGRHVSGKVTAKSAYALLLEKDNLPASLGGNRKFWGRLWNMNIKPKWKTFLWILLNKALALQVNLEKRGIFIPGSCHLCNNIKESEEHLFRDCNVAARVWMGSCLGIQTTGNEYIPINQWITNFLSKFWKEDGVDSERGLWFCAILWSIWLHRNHVVFRGANPNPYHVLRMAEELVREEVQRREDLKRATAKYDHVGVINRGEIIFSHGTSQGRQCIISVDGAWKRVRKKTSIAAGIGWIAKEGDVVIFSGNDIVRANSALQCEGLAVVRAITEALNKGEEDIKVLTDSESLINSLNQNLFPLHLFNICQDIRKYCELLSSCEIVKVDRYVVQGSHELAVKARQGFIV